MKIRLLLPFLLPCLLVHAVVANAQWRFDGATICTEFSDQAAPTIVSDGSGGAILTWHDFRSGISTDIYAQRVNLSGVVQWTVNGAALCTAANNQVYPTIVSDGSGGAIVTWYDYRNGSNYDIYAQRISASGMVLWTANGVALCTAANDQYIPTIISDGAAGAVVTWYDRRSGTNYDIYAQRISASGMVLWTANGVALCTATNDQFEPTIVSDGSGGAIVAWYDYRSGTSTDIYTQRVNASGVVQWTANGVALCAQTGDQNAARITSDGSGGAIVTWHDSRTGGNYDIYAQRVSAAGAAQWTANGVVLCTAANSQTFPTIATDGSGGAIVAWQDFRNGSNDDIYAQRVDGSGAVQWTTDGVALGTAADIQQYPTIASDGTGGAIVTWADRRSGVFDIYAQRVEGRYGYWGRPEPTLYSAADNPNDQGGKVILNWTASGRDVVNQQAIAKYTIWRAMDVAPSASSGATFVKAPSTAAIPEGALVVWHERTPTVDYFWELVGSQVAYYNSAYSFTAATRQDSTSTSTATHYFRVAAEGPSQFYNWPSNVLSAHSVDNLAPAAPLQLTAQRVGSDVHLQWNGVRVPDLKDYSVYRAASSGVTPVPGNFLASDTDTVLVDASAPTSALYYIVTAIDVHENQSAASNEASVGALTGVGNTPAPRTLEVHPNHPNPFAATTTLEIGLPDAGAIRLEVYDVTGRRVRAMEIAGVKGRQSIPFSGEDDRGRPLASGVYFYKVKAGGRTITRKMMITR